MATSAVQHKAFAAGNDAVLGLAERDSHYARLMAVATGGRNSHAVATMLASWRTGRSSLPAWLGLAREDYRALFLRHFPGEYWSDGGVDNGELDLDRFPERDDLLALLLEARAGQEESEVWLAQMIAAACMGMDHLWQDMGLWSRQELSELMQRNFPSLAGKNDRNMKWKKFLYKQLCEQEGIYVCRAPSCEVCSDYLNCFGPEE